MERSAKWEAVAIIGRERVHELETRGLSIVWSKELAQLLEKLRTMEAALEIAKRELALRPASNNS
ncbi:MAG: hypothetical protein AB1489_40525 [Acidobacteriota bacterium]